MKDVYVVEKILAKRYSKGVLEYKIKWKDWDDPKDITWEPAANCDCPDLKKQFEENQKKTQGKIPSSSASKRSSTADDSQAEEASSEASDNNEVAKQGPRAKKTFAKAATGSVLQPPAHDKLYRCDKGSKIEKLIGVKKASDGELAAYVQYEDGSQETVPTRVVANRVPLMLIEFYESRIRYLKHKNGGTAKNGDHEERSASSTSNKEN
ncbi:heterochromatin-associated protein [Aphelenchoides avenae]|nr:heterochromatin-associated protein [Aphelenchus avenae]